MLCITLRPPPQPPNVVKVSLLTLFGLFSGRSRRYRSARAVRQSACGAQWYALAERSYVLPTYILQTRRQNSAVRFCGVSSFVFEENLREHELEKENPCTSAGIIVYIFDSGLLRSFARFCRRGSSRQRSLLRFIVSVGGGWRPYRAPTTVLKGWTETIMSFVNIFLSLSRISQQIIRMAINIP